MLYGLLMCFLAKGVLRGLHFQQPYRQSKSVQVLDGGVFDMIGCGFAQSFGLKLAKSLQFGLLSTCLVRQRSRSDGKRLPVDLVLSSLCLATADLRAVLECFEALAQFFDAIGVGASVGVL